MLIDLEGHGREELFADVDLSRTVGWFTSLFPVRLDPGALDLDEALAGGPALGRALKPIKEQLRALPDHGLGYGLLRYLNPRDGRAARQALRPPQIGFNYLGRFAAPAGADWAAAAEGGALGLGGDPAMPLAHALEINALTLDAAGGPSLTATWSFAPALLADDGGARRWPQGWFAGAGSVGAPCRAARRRRAHPSDLPLVALTQGEIEALERRYPQIEDMLPLSPLQEGLLFHALYDAQAPDVYTVQLVLALQGPLDCGAAGGRAGAARTPCQPAGRLPARGPGRPVQVIVPRVALPWRSLDLSLLDAASRAGAAGRDPGRGPRRALRSRGAAAPALHADPAGGRPSTGWC